MCRLRVIAHAHRRHHVLDTFPVPSAWSHYGDMVEIARAQWRTRGCDTRYLAQCPPNESDLGSDVRVCTRPRCCLALSNLRLHDTVHELLVRCNL